MGQALLQIGAASFYYKLGQPFFITNWGSLIITNQGKFYYKSGQLLQIRATVITNWGSYYKLGQTLLQIRAAITNWGNYYKLGHNNCLIIVNIRAEDEPTFKDWRKKIE